MSPERGNLPTFSNDMSVAAHLNKSRFRSWTVKVLFLPRISSVVQVIFAFSAWISEEGAS